MKHARLALVILPVVAIAAAFAATQSAWKTSRSDSGTKSGAVQSERKTSRSDSDTESGVVDPGLGSDEATLRRGISETYQQYRHAPGAEPSHPKGLRLSKNFEARLMREGNGELSYDPICQCQDYDESQFTFAITSLDVNQGVATALVAVSHFGDAPTPIRLELRKTAKGEWEIDDTSDESGN